MCIRDRLYTVCITGIDGVDGTAHLPVLPVVRGQQLQAGALAPVSYTHLDVYKRQEDSLQGDRAILDILARCGARITRTDGAALFEKSALRGTEIDLADCPDLGPVLMVLGALCKGETVIRNAARLRIDVYKRQQLCKRQLWGLLYHISKLTLRVSLVFTKKHGIYAARLMLRL